MVATRREDVAGFLRKENILITSIKPKPKEWKPPRFTRKISDRDVAVFSRQFSSMIDAGLPLVQCLEILSSQSNNPFLSDVIAQTKIAVEGGATFSDALRRHPDIFNAMYVNMMAAGEASGNLDVVSKRLALHTEKLIKLKHKVKSSMIYPSVVIGVAMVVTTILLVWVVPIFAKMFTDFGGTLPWLTQLLIRVSDFMRGYFILMVIGLFLTGWALRKYGKTDQGRMRIEAIALAIPGIRAIVVKIAVARFSRTLGTLIASGVPILDGMGIAAKTCDIRMMEQAVLRIRQDVSEGKTIAEPLGKEPLFPKMVVQMIVVGETTGSLDVMLNKVADFYEDDVDAAITAFTALLEPALMVFVGLTIGTIVMAITLPIFRMAALVG